LNHLDREITLELFDPVVKDRLNFHPMRDDYRIQHSSAAETNIIIIIIFIILQSSSGDVTRRYNDWNLDAGSRVLWCGLARPKLYRWIMVRNGSSMDGGTGIILGDRVCGICPTHDGNGEFGRNEQQQQQQQQQYHYHNITQLLFEMAALLNFHPTEICGFDIYAPDCQDGSVMELRNKEILQNHG
jgi:hypothetical protein